MTSSDQKTQARRVVSERLRVFFSQLQQQLAASTDALRRRIEAKIPGGEEGALATYSCAAMERPPGAGITPIGRFHTHAQISRE